MSNPEEVGGLLSNTVKVLSLESLDLFYVAPANNFSSFGVVNVPYCATYFAKGITEIPSDVLKIFSNAKYVHVKLTWEFLEI